MAMPSFDAKSYVKRHNDSSDKLSKRNLQNKYLSISYNFMDEQLSNLLCFEQLLT